MEARAVTGKTLLLTAAYRVQRNATGEWCRCFICMKYGQPTCNVWRFSEISATVTVNSLCKHYVGQCQSLGHSFHSTVWYVKMCLLSHCLEVGCIPHASTAPRCRQHTKHSLIYWCVLDHTNRVTALQPADQNCYIGIRTRRKKWYYQSWHYATWTAICTGLIWDTSYIHDVSETGSISIIGCGQECDALLQARKSRRQDIPVACPSMDSKPLIQEVRTLHNNTVRTSNPT